MWELCTERYHAHRNTALTKPRSERAHELCGNADVTDGNEGLIRNRCCQKLGKAEQEDQVGTASQRLFRQPGMVQWQICMCLCWLLGAALAECSSSWERGVGA